MADKTPAEEIADSMMNALGYTRADIKTEKTVAEELRQAAAKLRATAEHVAHGPWYIEGRYPQSINNAAAVLVAETFTGPQVPPYEAQWITLVGPELAEPLAFWLEKTSHIVDSFRLPSHPEHEPCDDPCCYTAHHALAVARVLNGGDRA